MKPNPKGDKGRLKPRLPNPLALLPLPLGGEVGLGPTEETAEALLCHDPLFIRTGPATESRAHSHKNMILQRGNLAGLEGACSGKILDGSFFLFFFLQFFFTSLCCNFFSCDSGFLSVCLPLSFFFLLNKTLALKDSNTIQTVATNPTPGAPAGQGALGAPSAFFFVAVFLVPSLASGARGQVRGPVAGGICTAVT